MTKDGHAVAILSGDLTVEQRISVLDRFRAGLEKVLITTNVLARGKCARFNIYHCLCVELTKLLFATLNYAVRELQIMEFFYDNSQVST